MTPIFFPAYFISSYEILIKHTAKDLIYILLSYHISVPYERSSSAYEYLLYFWSVQWRFNRSICINKRAPLSSSICLSNHDRIEICTFSYCKCKEANWIPFNPSDTALHVFCNDLVFCKYKPQFIFPFFHECNFFHCIT